MQPDNARYAIALINGENLSSWHEREDWRERVRKVGKGEVIDFDPKSLTIARMAQTAQDTTDSARGQEVTSTAKIKELGFNNQWQFEKYLRTLFDAQKGLCAITGLELQLDRAQDDEEMRCSLDRIDSDGHYEAGNLQIVCRFINRWKSDQDDGEFRRLLRVVQSVGEMAKS